LAEPSMESIAAALADAEATDHALCREIEELRVAAELKVAQALPELEAISEDLWSINDQFEGLRGGMEQSAALVRRVGAELTSLREAKAKVAESIALVEMLLQIDRCEAETTSALSAGDFESAVKLAQQLGSHAAEAGDALDRETAERIAHLGDKVGRAVDVQLESALSSAEIGAVGRFCKLLSPLGRGEEGAAKYVDFCAKQLAAVVETADGGGEPRVRVPQQLSRLLRRVAELLAASAQTYANDGGDAT